MRTLEEAFARLEPPQAWEARAWPRLGERHWEPPAQALADARGQLATEGWIRLGGVLAPEEASALADGVRRLEADGLPALFAYVFDPLWQVPARFARALEHVLGGPFDLVRDVWAWHVPPGRAGWAPHRGVYEVSRSASGAPGFVNVWIALTLANEENAGMWLVPLPRDPAYPNALRDHGAAEGGRAIPLDAQPGTLLAWNANALHWGGASSAQATTPRVSFSFSLRAAWARDSDAVYASLETLPLTGPQTVRERLDLLAEMVDTYGHNGLSDGVRLWARATNTLRASRRAAH
jgi:hypothetical protein